MSGYFAGKSVLVTGAAGFVGSHLCHRLAAEGARVTGADNLSFARPDRPDGSPPLVNADIRDAPGTKALMEAHAPDVVFHLAAIANPRTCKQDFGLAYDVNVTGTQNVFRFSPPKARIVFISSAAVYGNPEYLPIDEKHPRRGSDPYSVTKILGEDLATCYVRNYQRDIGIVRNFNTYGVGQTGDYIVPQLIRQALTERKMELWDPKTVRDLMYIDNTVEALLAVATSAEKDPVNVGSGRSVTVGDLAKTIAARFGGDLPILDLKKSAGGSSALVSNNDRLRSLGWTERVSFEEGIARTIEWTRGQLGGTAGTAP
jgi:nucleoside-diphosphate-sugar epimerase